MSKEKETDAATVLSQMSQLVCVTSSFDFPSSQDPILDEDAIGATCTLQPSSLDSDILFSLSSHSSLVNSKKVQQEDPYIGFDDSEHPYAANMSETSNAFPNLAPMSVLSPFKKPKAVDGADILTCMICNKHFKKYHSLMVHMRFHAGEKSYVCDICPKSFVTKSDLTRHGKVHYDKGVQLYKCETCAKGFRDHATLTRHNRIHNPKSLIQCKLCERTFTRSDCHKNHMRTHLQDKPYKCHICKSEFTYHSSYKRHLIAHDPDSLFICDVCGKSFRRSDYVERHKKLTHSNTGNIAGEEQDPSLSAEVSNVDKGKRNKKQRVNTVKKAAKKKLSKIVTDSCVGNMTGSDDNTNAVPILMSMAEQAAKPKKVSPFITEATSLLESDLMPQEANLPSSPSNIGDELVNFVNEDSSGDEETIYTDDEDFDDVDRFSDRLEMFSDNEF